VSYDSESQLKAFKEKYNLPFDLLSDSEKTMGSKYGVNSFHFFPQRKTFLIDEEGILVHIFEDINLNSHPEDILKKFNQHE
tara:strand:+ start:247 stop:489 length:243 start_codon:yes stop_codon:yes gene_type:complete